MKILTSIVVIAAVVLGIWFSLKRDVPPPVPEQPKIVDYKNIEYTIEGQPVTLINGHAESAIASSSSSVVTEYFGNDAVGDLNNDGKPDIGFILTQSGGGSGTFYYAVAALKTDTGYQGTNAVLLGDRISPQTSQIEYGELVVNYADRKAGEPMTATTSVGVSKYLQVTGTTLADIPPSMYAAGNLLLGTGSNKKLGTYLVGSNGKTLYLFARDTPNGLTECVDACAEAWPPYTIATTSALANVQAGIDGPVGVFVRIDGALQVTYKGLPVYYYALDAKPGDTTGQGSHNVWSVAKP